jgi:hypothetical protein
VLEQIAVLEGRNYLGLQQQSLDEFVAFGLFDDRLGTDSLFTPLEGDIGEVRLPVPLLSAIKRPVREPGLGTGAPLRFK